MPFHIFVYVTLVNWPGFNEEYKWYKDPHYYDKIVFIMRIPSQESNHVRQQLPSNNKHRAHLSDQLVIHYNDVIMGAISSQITSLASVYSTV